MTVDKTYIPKGKVESQWLLVDANGQSLGRLATQIARYLLGKHKPAFTPGADSGDFVVVINAGHLALSNKQMDTKWYHKHSGYPGGLKSITMRDQLRKNPVRVLHAAVWGMIPHTKQGHQIIKKLKVYSGNEHPHEAQNPQTVA
jgi:large subunit ribosomal protein L13